MKRGPEVLDRRTNQVHSGTEVVFTDKSVVVLQEIKLAQDYGQTRKDVQAIVPLEDSVVRSHGGDIRFSWNLTIKY